jgi:hypothetical protein
VSPERPGPLWRRAVVGFGRFWWEFLVGDTPELLLGSALAVVGADLLVHCVGARAVVIGSLPVLVVAVLALSVYRARARSRARDAQSRSGLMGLANNSGCVTQSTPGTST